MSADNIGVCPRCYSKTPWEYPDELNGSLREYYYAIGVSPEGELEIEYHASCWDCGWTYVYKHKEQVYDSSTD